MGIANEQIRSAEVVMPCRDLAATLHFFTETLAFRVEAISPADDPAVAVISGHGVRLRLQRHGDGDPGVLRLCCTDADAIGNGARELTAPNGTRIEIVEADQPLMLPPEQPSFCLTRGGDLANWGTGRATMQYRDLVPDRQGGRFVASHIRITQPGPVPDYVHFHRVRFQMIYCYRGWAKLVYEDQGPPFVLAAGDCVLQPPTIRHRVLDSGGGLEVIEIGCPAEHETLADHDMSLPTASLQPERRFAGQRFVRHQAHLAVWQPWRVAGFECRAVGIAAATDGLAEAVVVRPKALVAASDRAKHGQTKHNAEFVFAFVLEGQLTLERGDDAARLQATDCFVMPAGQRHRLTDPSADLQMLEVTLPAQFDSTT